MMIDGIPAPGPSIFTKPGHHIGPVCPACALLATEVDADSHHHRESCDGHMAQGCP